MRRDEDAARLAQVYTEVGLFDGASDLARDRSLDFVALSRRRHHRPA